MKYNTSLIALTLLGLALAGCSKHSPDASSSSRADSVTIATSSDQPASTNHFREVQPVVVTDVQKTKIAGMGVELGVRDHMLQIMGVLPNGPAAKAGLHSGLIVQQIDGTNIVGKPLVECVPMTRGPVGSKVQLEVIDPAKSETNIVEIIREQIASASKPR